MALAVSHTFADQETLTHTLLNAIETNIVNNALALINPLTGDLAAGDNDITGIGLLEGIFDCLLHRLNLATIRNNSFRRLADGNS